MNVVETTCYVDELKDEEWEGLLEVTEAAFREHREKGLAMALCGISSEQLKKYLRNCYVFTIRDNGRIIAYRGIKLGFDGVHHFAQGQSVAVLPEYKGKGLGRKLFLAFENFARNAGCSYIVTDTSCKAKSSQAYHKSCGFKVWYYICFFPNKNYRSVVLRKDLTVSRSLCSRWKSIVYSWMMVHLKYRHDGNRTKLNEWYLRFMNRPPMDAKLLSLREVQETVYKVLVEFDALCKRHNLRYFLCYGSLIGAIRHKGFIPWDDDIDVTMPLPDYEKLISIFDKTGAASNLELLYGMKRNIGVPFAMLVDKNTLTVKPGRDKKHSHPIGIDIFPAYALSDDRDEAQQQIDDIWKLVGQSHAYLRAPSWLHFLRRVKFLICARRKLKKTLDVISAIIYKYPWGTTRHIRLMSLEEHERKHLVMRPDEFDHYLLWEFETGKFRVPETYHEHLSELYGDYMSLPPEEQRRSSLAKAYRLR